MAAPVANFSADNLTPFLGVDTVTFTDLSTNVPTKRLYIFEPQGTYNWQGFLAADPAGPSSPDDLYYNITDDKVYYYTGVARVELTGGSISTLQNPTHIFGLSSGLKTIWQYVYNLDGEDREIKIDYINVLPPIPVADFSSNDTTPTTNDIVTFTDLSTNTPTSWEWNFGDGTPHSHDQNPTHQYTTPGTYNVTLTATNAYGSNIEAKLAYEVVSLGVPVANFTGLPVSGIVPLAVQFTDTSTNTPTSRSRDFGDGTPPDVTENPLHTYAVAGDYTVTLISTNGTGPSLPEVKVDYIHVSNGINNKEAFIIREKSLWAFNYNRKKESFNPYQA